VDDEPVSVVSGTSGLRSIWFQPTAMQQYYPLSGTSFWLDYQFWKFWTTPYHVENVLVHACPRCSSGGCCSASGCRRLAGRALFALHPVMVESVAWITERKNVLSLVLYLGALLAYLRYAESVPGGGWPAFAVLRRGRQVTGTAGIAAATGSSRDTCHTSLFYWLAFVLFLCALLAKRRPFRCRRPFC